MHPQCARCSVTPHFSHEDFERGPHYNKAERFPDQRRIHRRSMDDCLSMDTILFLRSIMHCYSYMRYIPWHAEKIPLRWHKIPFSLSTIDQTDPHLHLIRCRSTHMSIPHHEIASRNQSCAWSSFCSDDTSSHGIHLVLRVSARSGSCMRICCSLSIDDLS
jgi:hypothetical protein